MYGTDYKKVEYKKEENFDSVISNLKKELEELK